MNKRKLVELVKRGLRHATFIPIGRDIVKPGDFKINRAGLWIKCWECYRVGFVYTKDADVRTYNPLWTQNPFTLECGHSWIVRKGKAMAMEHEQ